jgi:hypothetical protein
MVVHHHVPFAELLCGVEETQEINNQSGGKGRRDALPSREAQKIPRTYKYVVPTIKTTLAEARSKYPTLTISDLMAATSPPLTYAQVRLGPAGSCLDYFCFGLCKDKTCRYKHPERDFSANAGRVKYVAGHLGAAYNAYDAAQSTQ